MNLDLKSFDADSVIEFGREELVNLWTNSDAIVDELLLRRGELEKEEEELDIFDELNWLDFRGRTLGIIAKSESKKRV